MEFHAYHGVYEEERSIGNRFCVDVKFEANLIKAAATDAIEDTINYEIIYEIVASEMSITSKLLENVTERIFAKIKSEFPHISALSVKITKNNPPLKGKVQKVSVEKIA
jgi:dihydroneopterin aldolase